MRFSREASLSLNLLKKTIALRLRKRRGKQVNFLVFIDHEKVTIKPWTAPTAAIEMAAWVHPQSMVTGQL